MSLLNKTWIIKQRDPEKDVMTKIYENRGIFSESDREGFLLPSPEECIHDPFLMEDMEKAVDRIDRAIKDKERIVIFGDYDADGVTATAVLVRMLKKIGAEVSYRIPHRLKDGYSLKNYFLDELKELNVKVLITVDNGIAAAREIAYANDLGMDIIVTDHHTPPPKDKLPKAVATLNPKLEGCPYPFKELSGSGVALKLAEALGSAFILDRAERNAFVKNLYQIAIIGLIADCTPLIGENRAMVKIGLQGMREEPIRGLEVLMDVAGVDPKSLNAIGVAFMIAPRLNAAGRLDSAYDALHLFLNTTDSVDEIAKKLHALNAERRTITEDFSKEAMERLAKEDGTQKMIIVDSPNWNSGINGLIASRLVEKFAKPVIVLADKGDDLVASCRSVEEFNIIEAITEVGDLFEHFGGHPGAAGFSIKKEHYPLMREKLFEIAKRELGDKELKGKLRLESDIKLDELSWQTFDELTTLEPFGIGNEKPTFVLESIELLGLRTMGAEGKHLSFELQNGIRGVGFSFGEYVEDMKNKSLDIAFQLDINEWQGKKSLQVRMVDVRINS
ncbi:MAG: single-stranded-DNA-specific exonuclease RecJ [Candidatus Gracilibacteria bacterium]